MVKMHGIQILLSNGSIKQIEFLSNKGELNEIRGRVRSERRAFTRSAAPPAAKAPDVLPRRRLQEAGGASTQRQKRPPSRPGFWLPINHPSLHHSPVDTEQ